ncbi:DUF1792 domain-containing protein [Limosilactobacillus sp. RRLNB_1_1]|uniref:DUF1792 domain-containing protein n=1 Tax=Limosilactobacillus albertensis TaxID=2759752 RepID=A0A7W3TT39_9LACO|nr:GT-D fold domain-containing glycosyltransferase [Limosilactobacillus albertensis]MBB1070188.1 DUF1792 domain-containing protein [Limosilactobacillus albertensis]MCD7119216.1 GT-D fold domain-containing protein [Limosilactobacillus albertensis]MCD7129424.1 GT-D fold domain-containing protein [Limosilactobacillus albertensis]
MVKQIIKSRIGQFFIRLVSGFLFIPYYIYAKRMNLRILDASKTVEYILNNNISVGRIGDGEFNIMFSDKSIGFQKASSKLKNELINLNANNNFLLALPHGLETTREYNIKTKVFWWRYVTFNHKFLIHYSENHGGEFLDTNFSRVVTEFKNKEAIDKVIKNVCRIWKNRNVIIIEGKFTRFGMNNDLLDNAKSVNRIIAPAENAYSKIDEIYKKTCEIASNIENPIIIISLGPTATILSYRLSPKYQSIDIGHFDLQYEYLRRGYYHKVSINDRYDNEMKNGNKVKKNVDKYYKDQIRVVIE